MGEPVRRVHEGRWVVSRAWIVELTGASGETVARWYRQRLQEPEGRRHPEVACTMGRTYYFDQQAVESFWAVWQEEVGVGLLGAAGRRAGDGRGANGGGPGREQRDQAVALALAALREAGGYRRGLAAQLVREHGGVARSWQRAVGEARAIFESEEAGRDAAP
ncbi:hypothetical protein [Streptomyces adustus]